MSKVKCQRLSEGYSLIELLVAIGVFSIVVSALSGIFAVSLKSQGKTQTLQNVADNVRYAMEVMAKEVRMARMGPTFPAPNTYSTFTFESNMPNRNGSTVRFQLSGGSILFDDDVATGPGAEPITSSANVNVTRLSFIVTGQYPSTQPRITIVMEAESAGTAPDVATRMQAQTTVSPRSL